MSVPRVQCLYFFLCGCKNLHIEKCTNHKCAVHWILTNAYPCVIPSVSRWRMLPSLRLPVSPCAFQSVPPRSNYCSDFFPPLISSACSRTSHKLVHTMYYFMSQFVIQNILSCIHVACIICSSYYWVMFHLWIYEFVTHSSSDGRLGCFQDWAIMDKAAMKLLIHVVYFPFS